MDDISANILNERREPYRPTKDEIRDGALQILVEGRDPDPGARTHMACPECGYQLVTGRESHGPDVPGLRETIEWVAENYSGTFDAAEIRELVAAAVVEVLDDQDEAGLDADTHETLDEYSGEGL
jgi:hypothetical protein